MTQTTLDLDRAIQQGRQQAQVCLEATRREVEQSWPERAYLALEGVIKKYYQAQELVESEKLIACTYLWTDLEKAHDDRAWGGVFAKLARNGIIRKSNQTYRRSKGHGSPAFYWEVV